jgi:pimeloyl-ACP methyl ester carboxylesterase
MRLFIIAAALLALAHAPAAAQTAAPARTEAPCTLPGLGAARCGTLEVWENRAARSGRTITLRYAVVPATGQASDDPVVLIAGGPGQAAIALGPAMVDEVRALRDTRDILLLDARGAGTSNPLRCELYGPRLEDFLGAFFPAERVRRCAEEWRGRADVAHYTTNEAADDLDDLRAALGYARLNLFGTSYGTRTALVYARRHPERVRTIVLHGVAHTGIRMPERLAADAQRALEGVLADCAAQPACHAAFPAPGDDLRVVLARLDRAPAEVTVADPTTGDPANIRFTRERFAEGLRYMLYTAANASRIPTVLRQAARGDLSAAAEQAISSRRGMLNDASAGLYLSVTCAEDVPFVRDARAAEAARGTFTGLSRVRDQRAACAQWPARAVDADFLQPVRSSAPVLAITGQWDPATPPAQADEALRTLPNGRALVIPSAGHGYAGVTGVRECVNPLVERFIRTADAKSLDASCIATIHRPPFPMDEIPTRPVALRPDQLAPYAGSFASPRAGMIETRVEAGKLHARFQGREFILVPVGEDRFRVLGAPLIVLTFQREGGLVTGVTADGAAYTRVER